MHREKIIFVLTHLYPLFLVCHLYYGNHGRVWQILFTVIPLFVFGGLIGIWAYDSDKKLTGSERFSLRCLLWNLIFASSYYILCVNALPGWAYNRNYQASVFILITFIFYNLNHERR